MEEIDYWITVNETAKRTYRNHRQVLNWIYAGKVKYVQRENGYLLYWPSVAEFRGIHNAAFHPVPSA